jgi:triosephosphate isomerase
MQITSVGDAVKAASEINSAIEGITSVEVFIAPSFNSLYNTGQTIKVKRLKLAGQNIYVHEQGAFTGETSILSLIDAGCDYVILGHSERRRIFGEENGIINQKVHLVLNKGLKPVLCIGETAKEREEGRTSEVNQGQLAGSLKGVSEKQLQDVIIAYEPVWAINNKFLNPGINIKPATPDQASEAHAMVRKWFNKHYSKEVASEIRIIYGGSMKPTNARDLLSLEDIDGGLVGGASLSVNSFVPIISQAEQITKSKGYRWEGNTLKFVD